MDRSTPLSNSPEGGPDRLDRVLRFLFFWLLVRPVVLLVLGLNVRHRDRLPAGGPALVIANHNSHLDAMVLMVLFPTRLLAKLRPVAAADYFLRNRAMAWVSLHVLGILPIDRRTGPPGAPRAVPTDPLAGVSAALGRGEIVILFPEGTRGEPERLADFKSGIARLAERHPEVPVVPVFLHGLGKTLPRGAFLPVPFFCDVFVGEPVPWCGDRKVYVTELRTRMQALAAEGSFAVWE
jgi:1-acyl-sn-glycerol-3-phosphate acyltransferase